MRILKCAVCGGDILPRGNSGVCDSCGRQIPLSDLADDRKVENRNRANDARVHQDYQAAERAWSRIVADEPGSADAHWNLMLSRYGIDYAWDGMTGDFYPVMHSVRWDRVTDDPDYRAAMQCADENALVYYMNEGSRLEALRARMMDLVKDEPAYDVFLCTASRHNTDQDYAAAIYQALTAKGLRVFWERVNLQQIPVAESEPYIYSALYSSRVMVLYASAAEQLTDVTIRSEWGRFLALMEQDKHKDLIPAYVYMRPEFFPDEISTREAVDLTANGAMLDLVRGVLRLVGKSNDNAGYAEAMRIRQLMAEALGHQNYREAVRLGQEGTQMAPENADLWYLLFLAENRVSAEVQLRGKAINWMDSRSFARAYELATRQRRVILEQVKTDWDAYQRREIRERQFAEDEKESRRKAQDSLQRARTMMMQGQYSRAYALLSDNITATDESVALRDDAELGRRYEEIDKQECLIDYVEQEAPDALARFEQMIQPMADRPMLPWIANVAFVGAIVMVVGSLLSATGLVTTTVKYDLGILYIGMVIVAVSVLIARWSEIRGLIARIAAVNAVLLTPGGLLILIVDTLTDMLPAVLVYLLMAVLSAGLVFLAARDRKRQGNATENQCMAYYTQQIRPIEQRYIKDYRRRYKSLTQYAPLQDLTTVWDYYRVS